ncbi:MAG: rubredoxin [Clostridia bacterium]|nr:rubredoxin [Clostridia bacterium]
MEKYVCPCGYEYKVAQGDPENGVAPNTPWGEVPADWVCPVCGLGKEAFAKE